VKSIAQRTDCAGHGTWIGQVEEGRARSVGAVVHSVPASSAAAAAETFEQRGLPEPLG
jgi:hypothetical protein